MIRRFSNVRKARAALIATCVAGALSAVATPASAKTPGTYHPTPQNVQVTAGGTVTWSPVPGAAGYIVERDGAWVANPSGITWQDPVNDAKAHSYTVAAWFNGEGFGQIVFASPVTEPPLNVRVSQAHDIICWDPVVGHNSAPNDAYHIFLKVTGANFFAETTGSQTCLTVTGAILPSTSGETVTATVLSASEYDDPWHAESGPSASLQFTAP
jgi:hypothetical protein